MKILEFQDQKRIFLMMGGIGIQSAEAGTGQSCNLLNLRYLFSI